MSAERDATPGEQTRLGRVVRATTETAAGLGSPPPEQHRGVNWLRDVILGGQDGLVNMLGIILGVIAGGGSNTVLLAAGFAAAITESVSMGAVGYTSTQSERDYYLAERERELSEIKTIPDVERQEVRQIYADKGFSGELLEQVVTTITANRDRWLDTMMSEELQLRPIDDRQILRSSVVITVATLIGHMIPLVPFLFLARQPALITSIVVSGLVLFAVGAYQAISLVGDWRRQGIKMVVIGLGAAGIGFLVGRLFHTAA